MGPAPAGRFKKAPRDNETKAVLQKRIVRSIHLVVTRVRFVPEIDRRQDDLE